MNKEELSRYLSARREGWPYEESYRVDQLEGQLFVTRTGDELAYILYVEIGGD